MESIKTISRYFEENTPKEVANSLYTIIPALRSDPLTLCARLQTAREVTTLLHDIHGEKDVDFEILQVCTELQIGLTPTLHDKYLKVQGIYTEFFGKSDVGIRQAFLLDLKDEWTLTDKFQFADREERAEIQARVSGLIIFLGDLSNDHSREMPTPIEI